MFHKIRNIAVDEAMSTDMKTSNDMAFMRQFFSGRCTCLLWLGLCNLAFAQASLAQTNRAVTLELQCVGPQSDQQNLTDIVVTLNNTGNSGTAVVLGTRLGNIYLAKTLGFEARFGSGQFQNFLYDNPVFSNNSTGREDPWIVPLPAHSSYAVTISANHFMAASGERMDETADLADLQLHLTGSKIEPLNLDLLGLANWEVLVMDMQSAVVAIPDDCQAP